MATLQPAAGWDEVYQLEVTDPAQGGSGGVLNRQPQALLNRTAYLRALIDSIETELQGKAPVNHSHDASAITSGMLDPARIPTLPSQNTVTSSGNLSALTVDQQAQVVEGVIVTTTDGWRWVYTGSGSKIATTSYIQLADITPDWAVIQNKPSTFAPSAHHHAVSDIDDFSGVDIRRPFARFSDTFDMTSGAFDFSASSILYGNFNDYFSISGTQLKCIKSCIVSIMARMNYYVANADGWEAHTQLHLRQGGSDLAVDYERIFTQDQNQGYWFHLSLHVNTFANIQPGDNFSLAFVAPSNQLQEAPSGQFSICIISGA